MFESNNYKCNYLARIKSIINLVQDYHDICDIEVEVFIRKRAIMEDLFNSSSSNLSTQKRHHFHSKQQWISNTKHSIYNSDQKSKLQRSSIHHSKDWQKKDISRTSSSSDLNKLLANQCIYERILPPQIINSEIDSQIAENAFLPLEIYNCNNCNEQNSSKEDCSSKLEVKDTICETPKKKRHLTQQSECVKLEQEKLFQQLQTQSLLFDSYKCNTIFNQHLQIKEEYFEQAEELKSDCDDILMSQVGFIKYEGRENSYVGYYFLKGKNNLKMNKVFEAVSLEKECIEQVIHSLMEETLKQEGHPILYIHIQNEVNSEVKGEIEKRIALKKPAHLKDCICKFI